MAKLPVNSRDPIAVRASRKLRSDEFLVTTFAATRLRMDLDRSPWRGDHVAIKQLIEDYARYLYLSRLWNRQFCWMRFAAVFLQLPGKWIHLLTLKVMTGPPDVIADYMLENR